MILAFLKCLHLNRLLCKCNWFWSIQWIRFTFDHNNRPDKWHVPEINSVRLAKKKKEIQKLQIKKKRLNVVAHFVVVVVFAAIWEVSHKLLQILYFAVILECFFFIIIICEVYWIEVVRLPSARPASRYQWQNKHQHKHKSNSCSGGISSLSHMSGIDSNILCQCEF